MREAMYGMHVRMQIGDWIFGFGLPISKVVYFRGTNVDWIFDDDASKVDFCFERPMKFGIWLFGSGQCGLDFGS